MQRALVLAGAVVLAVHGLIHLMGTVTYLKLGTVDGLTYKTTVLGGRWDLGENGTKLFGVFWAVAAVGFMLAAAAWAAGWPWA